MSTPLVIERAGRGQVRIGGRLDFSSAARAVMRVGELLDGSERTDVDASGLDQPDSAALAVLLAWAASARARGSRLHFQQLPPGLQALAHLCGTEQLLGIQDA